MGKRGYAKFSFKVSFGRISILHKPGSVKRTHQIRMMHICICKSGHHWFRKCLGTGLYRLTVNSTCGKKLHSNWNKNTIVFIQKRDGKISSEKWRPFCFDLTGITHMGYGVPWGNMRLTTKIFISVWTVSSEPGEEVAANTVWQTGTNICNYVSANYVSVNYVSAGQMRSNVHHLVLF